MDVFLSRCYYCVERGRQFCMERMNSPTQGEQGSDVERNSKVV